MTYLPAFQAQNPSISGYRYGWVSCTAFATAMVIDATTSGAKRPSGGQVRKLTDEPVPDPGSPGLSLAQIDAAANRLGVDLDVRYRMSWADFSHRAFDLLQPYVLATVYAPIADSRFDAGHGFRGNHAVAGVGRVILDPLADGRYAGVYKYHGETYPDDLIRRSAQAYPGGIQAAFAPAAVGVPVPPPFKPVLTPPPAPAERNVMIPQGGIKVVSDHVMQLPAGQPLYRYPGGPRVTAMSKAGPVAYIGSAGAGWRAVQVDTAAGYADHLARPTVVYVPAAAGQVVPR